jgi:6-pyruvoyltetrahydropterin/6-carboxytetrahydropterin synthase
MITAHRYHDFSCGHRVYGHESKCAHLHGHNYRVTFECVAERLDQVGRVIDFSVIKSQLCNWLEDEWDHKMLIWAEDPLVHGLQAIDPAGLVVVPFNPTAENMADYLLRIVGAVQLDGTGVTLVRVTVQETAKCGATALLEKGA